MNNIDDPDKDRDFLTQIPESLLLEYYCAVGKLMNTFALIEANLNITLSSFVDELLKYPKELVVPETGNPFSLKNRKRSMLHGGYALRKSAVIRSIVVGQSVENLKRKIKDILKITKANESILKKVNHIFDQLGKIQVLRNILAHNGATPDMSNKNGWFIICTRYTSKTEESTQIIKFQPKTLLYAERDLSIMPELLYSAFYPELLLTDPIMQTARMKAYLKDLNGPWHYNPTQLKCSKSNLS